jgi:hypothetical protein
MIVVRGSFLTESSISDIIKEGDLVSDKPKSMTTAAKLKAVTADLILDPSEAQCVAKARFWRKMSENPLYDADKISTAQIERMTGSSMLTKWWANPKFRDWFLEKEHIYYAVSALAEKAVAVLWEVLDDPTASAKTRVDVAKLALDLKGVRPPSRKEVRWADVEIQKKSPEELDQYIAERLKKLPAASKPE